MIRCSTGAALAAPVLFLAAAAGCSNDGPAEPPRQRDASFFADLRYEIPSAEVVAILESTTMSDYVKDVVRDGTVTFGEYEAAVLDTVTCLQDLGAVTAPGEPKLSARGLYTWTATGKAPASDPADHEALRAHADRLEACAQTFWSPIDYFWIRVVEPTEREKATAMKDLEACLEKSGLAEVIPPSRSYESFEALLASSLPEEVRLLVRQCGLEVEEKWALPKFVP